MSKRNPLNFGAVILSVVFLACCIPYAEQNADQKPTQKSDPPQTRLDAKAPAAQEAQDKSVFHAGDALLITTYPDTTPFFRGIHRVDDQGFVDLPVVGKVLVLDKSEKELADALAAAYVNYLRYPIVQVRPLIRVSLLGGFYHPGLYWVPPSSSLWDVVNIAGGTQREDGIKKLRWERSKLLIKSDLVEDFQSGSSLKQMGFNSGDQLWVTSKPIQQFWDLFQANILPFLSVTVSIASTSLVAYEIYITNRPKN
jgi:protein involved in polysaccharide export with SLBB domain